MLKLSRLTDYAIVVMGRISQLEDGHVCSASDVSRNIGVPEPTVAQILKQLTRAGLLEARRGVNGGYRPLKAAEEMTVADIIVALDGPIALTACVDGGEGGCSVARLCPVRGNWDKVNQAVAGAFESVTIADMLCPPDYNDMRKVG